VTEAEKLDRALRRINRALNDWGVDNYLGYRTEQTLRLSADGATNLERLLDLLDLMTDRVAVLTAKLEEVETVYEHDPRQVRQMRQQATPDGDGTHYKGERYCPDCAEVVTFWETIEHDESEVTA
jgi:hypothetical protein